MKIITQGDRFHNIRWVIDYGWPCGHCQSVIQIEPNDLKAGTEQINPDAPARVLLHDDQRDGEYFTAICPACGKHLSGSKGRGIELADRLP